MPWLDEMLGFFDYDRLMIKILTVCTGNVCRSPFAELFLQNELNKISPGSFKIRSAGTHALVGHPMDQRSSFRLNEAGVSSEGFIAKQITTDSTNGVDLVLALTDKHRNSVVASNPKLLKRTFTLREFAAVIDGLEASPINSLPQGTDIATVEGRWADLLSKAQLARHTARKNLDGHLDVTDPFRRSDDVYDQMVDEMLPALRTIVRFEYSHAIAM